MASRKAIGERHHQALSEVVEILTRHDPEVGEHVRRANHASGIPNPVKKPLEHSAFVTECLLSLSRIVDRKLTPRPVGRPRKAS
jgi:hypothetical protein